MGFEWTRGGVVAVTLVSWGCRDPATSTHDAGATSDSGQITGTTTTQSTGSAGTDSTGSELDPLEGFELPEGCGDGVIVPGQYDCFTPVSLQWLRDDNGDGPRGYFGFDLEGDGRSEVIVISSASSNPRGLRILRWTEGELEISEPIGTIFTGRFTGYRNRFDWNGDGRPDLTHLLETGDWPKYGNGPILMHSNLGSSLRELEWVHTWPDADGGISADGYGVPFDVDADGEYEIMVSRMLGDPNTESNPANELVVRKRAGDDWRLMEGVTFPFGGCGWLWTWGYGDFNEDGYTDLAIGDAGTGCDPYPWDYDPEWYRIGVLLASPTAGPVLAGWFPIGEKTSGDEPLWVHDVDHDGHADLVVAVNPPQGGWGIVVMRGRGDGTFDEGTRREFAAPLPSNHLLQDRADLDGNGVKEWVAGGEGATGEGAVWVLSEDLSPDSPVKGAVIGDPESGWTMGYNGSVGDVNADNVDDYISRTSLRGAERTHTFHYLMLSNP